MMKINWINDPFPHAVIDNFLSEEQFKLLNIELDQSKNLIQRKFSSPLESKTIYKNTLCKEIASKLIVRMGSSELKKIIAQQIGDLEIVSMGDKTAYAGYSPYHITRNNGFLGAHVDHSSIANGDLRHIANTIFYASNEWEQEWGGQTILFSRNGLWKKVLIKPIPNRLIVFIHTANSFHGVTNYFSSKNIERRSFYHDYYVEKSNIIAAMNNLNEKRRKNLIHLNHGTTFIPFLPFGLDEIKLNRVFNMKNINYIATYLFYLSNLIYEISDKKIREILSLI